VGFDLEFASGQGFADLSEHDAAPTLQLAVIYTTVVRTTATGRAAAAAAAAGDAGDAGGAAAAEGWVVVRRLRLHTIQLPVARSARALLEAVQPEPLMVCCSCQLTPTLTLTLSLTLTLTLTLALT
jgi:hypothetical protein